MRGHDPADVLPAAGLGIGDVEDLAASDVGPARQEGGPDRVADVDEAHGLAPAEDGTDAPPDPAEILEEVFVAGAVDRPQAEEDDRETVLVPEDLPFGQELALAVVGDRTGRGVLPDRPARLGRADRGQAAHVDETGAAGQGGEGLEEICRAVPVYGIISVRFERFGRSGDMVDGGQALRQDGKVREIPREHSDVAAVLEPAGPGGIADEGVDLGVGLLEEPFDEVAAEEARSSRDEDPHDADCMRIGRPGQ